MRSFARRTLMKASSLLLLFSLLVPQVAVASPASQIEAARKEARAAQVKLDDLAEDLEMRTEDYLEVEAQLTQTRALIADAERDLDVATRDLEDSRARLSRRAVSVYRNGPVDVVSLLVGVTDFQDLVTRLDLMNRVGRSNAALVASVRDSRDRIEVAKESLEARREEQVVLRQRAADSRDAVERSLAAQKTYLASVSSRLKRLIAEERERQARLAAQRAAAAKAAALTNVRTLRGGRKFDPAALGSPHPEAVTQARRYLGVPYLWGGTTPSGFDCSGLVQYAYASIGISIPRTSRTQYRIGGYIPPNRLDLLQPGDLVFFGHDGDPSKIHHVGMYIGDGQMIHAPQTGDVVRVASLIERIQSRADYVGACRP